MGVLKPRTTSVVIYQGDDLDQLSELNRAVVRAETALNVAKKAASQAGGAPLRLGDPVPAADAADEQAEVKAAQAAYDAFVDEAADRAVVVTLTAIGRTRFRELLAEHPARTHEVAGKQETIEDDQLFEVDTSTFPLALLTYNRDGKRTVSIDPAVAEADLAEFFEEDCAEGDVERCWQAAYWLNRATGADPKDSKFSTDSPRLLES